MAIIENTHQRSPMVGVDALSLPEKTGELIAALHLLLVSTILRKLQKNKPVKEHKVCGDKIGGIVLCTVKVNFKKAFAPVEVAMTDYTGGMLVLNVLCWCLHVLFPKVPKCCSV